MALDYAATAALMVNNAFRDRIKVACLKYATYIFDETASTPAHSTRIRWAQQTTAVPDATVTTITPTVCMDAKVQEDGDAITDAELQTSVETSVNKLL
jgi:hypothetical protein